KENMLMNPRQSSIDLPLNENLLNTSQLYTRQLNTKLYNDQQSKKLPNTNLRAVRRNPRKITLQTLYQVRMR
ncbi:MAG: hypothetical protein QSU88_12960, partial [Candidatus Methanoperedens sp.]|nr:hypothetical protein [Candidatus Methanoperedens sp.]